MSKSFGGALGAIGAPLRVVLAALAVAPACVLGCSLLTDTSDLSGGISADGSAPEAQSTSNDSSVSPPTSDGAANDSGAAIDAPSTPDGSSVHDAAPEAAGDAAGALDAGTDASLSYAATVLADTPLAYWRLGESAGTTANDETGHGYTATVGAGATWGAAGAIAGDSNGAIHLSQDGFNAGVAFDFAGNAPYTLEEWFSPEVIDGTYRHLFSKNDEGADGGREEYGVFVQSSETLVLERFVTGTSVKTHAPLPPLNQYTYVVATYDGVTLALYVNGALSSTAVDTRAQQAKPVPEFFGCKGAQDGPLQGLVDEVAIYDHALSAASVGAHWAAAQAH